MTAWPHGDPRDVVQAIVADPRFTGMTLGTHQPTLLERLLQWIGDLLRPLFSQIGRLLGSDSIWNRGLGVLVLLAIGFGAIWLLVRVIVLMRPPRRTARTAMRPLDDVPTSRDLYARALAAARNERWRDAAAALLAAALHALDERGTLTYDAARTAGEARRALRDADFDELAREGTWALYAAGGATGIRFDRMRAAYDRLLGAPG